MQKHSIAMNSYNSLACTGRIGGSHRHIDVLNNSSYGGILHAVGCVHLQAPATVQVLCNRAW